MKVHKEPESDDTTPMPKATANTNTPVASPCACSPSPDAEPVKQLRVIKDPIVVAPPRGTGVRVRLKPTETEAETLTAIGVFLGHRYRETLVSRIKAGNSFQARHAWRTPTKNTLTSVTSSRWAGSLTRAANDQYDLSMRALQDHIVSLTAASAAITQRLEIGVGNTIKLSNSRKKSGYGSAKEARAKRKRLKTVKRKLEKQQARLDAAHPSVVLGGRKRLITGSNEKNLAAAGVTKQQWRDSWDAARMFLTADGETGRKGGNETIRVTPEGKVHIKIPSGLVPEGSPTHLVLDVPIDLMSQNGRLGVWSDRIAHRQSIGYTITYNPEANRWYLDAAWSIKPPAHLPTPQQLKGQRTLGVDLNADHLAAWVLDGDGNPVGDPHTIPLELSDLPASKRDAYLRHAISGLVRYAHTTRCTVLAVENLDFADARSTGRETMGRGRKGKTFRRTVAGIPTAKFRDRLAAMAYRSGLWIIAVDPAYTSKWGIEHWLKPLQQERKTSLTPPSKHHAAAVVIGRRAHRFSARRKTSVAGSRHRQRTVTKPAVRVDVAQAVGYGTSHTCGCGVGSDSVTVTGCT